MLHQVSSLFKSATFVLAIFFVGMMDFQKPTDMRMGPGPHIMIPGPHISINV